MPSKQLHDQAHEHCEMELRAKAQHIGLYCKEHGQWIQWVKKEQLDFYIYDLKLGAILNDDDQYCINNNSNI